MQNVIKIDLWFWQPDAPAATVARWYEHLSDDERARMARFVFAKDQTRYTICRSRMRRILGQYTRTAPSDVAFVLNDHDKPALAPPNPQEVEFNLTHTDGLACLAVTHGPAIGVDLERRRPVEDKFIAYTLNAAEYDRVTAPDAPREAAFFRYWTAKEAYLKSVGTGLQQSLKTFDVDVPLDTAPGMFARCGLPRVDEAEQRAQNWQIFTFVATDAHMGAVALAPPFGTTIEFRTRWIGAAP